MNACPQTHHFEQVPKSNLNLTLTFLLDLSQDPLSKCKLTMKDICIYLVMRKVEGACLIKKMARFDGYKNVQLFPLKLWSVISSIKANSQERLRLVVNYSDRIEVRKQEYFYEKVKCMS